MITLAASVSIIVPVYNSAKYLDDLFESLLGQSYSEIKVFCVDDGSTDDSVEVLSAWQKKDDRITVLTQENGGQSSARNHALNHIEAEKLSSDFVMMIDSDDMIKPDTVERLVQQMDSDQLDVLAFSGESFYESPQLEKALPQYKTFYNRHAAYEGVYGGPEYLCKIIKAWDFKGSSCMQMYRSTLLFHNSIRYYPGIVHEDNLFLFTCLVYSDRVSYVDEKFYQRRIRDNSTMSGKKSWKHVDGYFRCALEASNVLDVCEGRFTEEQSRILARQVRFFETEATRLFGIVDEEDRQLLQKDFYRGHDMRFFLVLVVFPYFDQMHLEQKIRDEFHASSSYRLGRTLTSLPRKILGR